MLGWFKRTAFIRNGFLIATYTVKNNPVKYGKLLAAVAKHHTVKIRCVTVFETNS